MQCSDSILAYKENACEIKECKQRSVMLQCILHIITSFDVNCKRSITFNNINYKLSKPSKTVSILKQKNGAIEKTLLKKQEPE